MAKLWDDTMKRLISAHPQHFVSWLLKDAQFVQLLPQELKNKTREADVIFQVLLNEVEMLLHLELQSRDDTNMTLRLLEYNVLAVSEYRRPVLSCVLYLRKGQMVAESPLEWKLPNGQRVLTFTFLVVKLWEVAAEEITRTGLVGLLPLLPLTRDGKRHEVIEEMIEAIVAARQDNLLTLSEIVAGLVFKDDQDQAWLKGRFAMHKDIFEESWVYQEIVQEGLAKGMQKGMEQGLQQGMQQGLQQGLQQGVEQAMEQERQRQLQAFVSIVQGRFPELTERAKRRANETTDPVKLQELLIKIGLAKDIEEAKQALMDGSNL
ncbi:MAG TPA: hypothetical protein VFB60_23125 [Ktedonobacteraceae bacterium]|nr:hypothetical protein [Ktedonobacteraceae bacterium]